MGVRGRPRRTRRALVAPPPLLVNGLYNKPPGQSYPSVAIISGRCPAARPALAPGLGRCRRVVDDGGGGACGQDGRCLRARRGSLDEGRRITPCRPPRPAGCGPPTSSGSTLRLPLEARHVDGPGRPAGLSGGKEEGRRPGAAARQSPRAAGWITWSVRRGTGRWPGRPARGPRIVSAGPAACWWVRTIVLPRCRLLLRPERVRPRTSPCHCLLLLCSALLCSRVCSFVAARSSEVHPLCSSAAAPGVLRGGFVRCVAVSSRTGM